MTSKACRACLALFDWRWPISFPTQPLRGLGTLLEGFLHAILPDRGQPEAMGVFRGGDGVGLGHGQQADGPRSPAASLAGPSNPAQNGLTLPDKLVIGDHLNTSGAVSPPSQRLQNGIFSSF